MIAITTTDFIGKFEVTTNEFTSTNLVEYISRYQKLLTVELLGVELFDLYEANPTDPEFVLIENPLTFQTDNGMIYESLGLKNMLVGFIYFMYTRDLYSRPSIVGVVKPSNENSTTPTNVSALLWQRYNESVNSYEAIQEYIKENDSVYTTFATFRGVQKDVIIPYF